VAENTFASRVYDFYTQLRRPRVPAGVTVMNPYADARVRECLRGFLHKYFGDNNPRVLVLGINPGRFGAGITGVTFADPVALADFCGIETGLPRRRELSSIFVYDFVQRFGGPAVFHRSFFLTAISPLGFTRGGKNLNYYDSPALAKAVTPFIVRSIEQQIALGGRRDHAIVLGTGTNFTFIQRLNAEHGFFAQLHALDHPRFIMQYRRRRLDEYLARYEATFRALVPPAALTTSGA
jgi:hypothetical protein